MFKDRLQYRAWYRHPVTGEDVRVPYDSPPEVQVAIPPPIDLISEFGRYVSAKDKTVPSVKVNGGNFVFTIATKETVDGFVGVVSVEGVEVWTTPEATTKKDDAYNNARRAVGKAFQNLLNG